jgi:hypothetical protein
MMLGVDMAMFSQMKRFWRIQNEFGTKALVRIFVLMIGLLGMALFDYLAFSRITSAVIAAVGLVVGFLLRHKIPVGVEYYPRALSVGLAVYSITLLLGDLIGLGNGTKLTIIAVTTVVIFDLQFWSLSDSSVMNAERETRGQNISR